MLLRQGPGTRQAVQVVPARRPGARRGFQVVSVRGDLHVIPGDVHHLVGRLLDLDPSLRSGAYVSLRTWARDATNGRIDQTLVRAFPVRQV